MRPNGSPARRPAIRTLTRLSGPVTPSETPASPAAFTLIAGNIVKSPGPASMSPDCTRVTPPLVGPCPGIELVPAHRVLAVREGVVAPPQGPIPPYRVGAPPRGHAPAPQRRRIDRPRVRRHRHIRIDQHRARQRAGDRVNPHRRRVDDVGEVWRDIRPKVARRMDDVPARLAQRRVRRRPPRQHRSLVEDPEPPAPVRRPARKAEQVPGHIIRLPVVPRPG